MTGQLHVICYDTPCDRRRRQFVRVLSRRGRRVQHSVFEVLLDRTALQRLMGRLQHLVEPPDSLLIYAASGLRIGLGRSPEALNDEPRSQVI